MEEQTKAFIIKHDMISRGGRILAGVSGGADSVCLLHLLNSLRGELDFELRALHVHHGLRGEEADRDAAFSQEICKKLGILCSVVRIDAAAEAREGGISVEEAGREARYRLLEEAAIKWEQEECGSRVRIAVAHHGDDSAETILHNLFRGSGLKGLGGIAPVRDRIIRPLLWTGREEIRNYLRGNGIPYVEDSSNQESEYTRNRLRNEILPLITETVNRQAVQNILRAGGWIRAADDCLGKMAGSWLDSWASFGQSKDNCESSGKSSGGGSDESFGIGFCLIPAKEIIRENDFLQGYIIRAAMERANIPLKDVTAKHVEKVIALAAGETGKQLCLPGGIRAAREYGSLKLWVEKTAVLESAAPRGGNTGGTLPFDLPEEGSFCGFHFRVFPHKNQAEIPKNQCTKWFDYDKIKDTLSVRSRRTGDYIMLRFGGRKTVKSFMIDEKVPRDRRDQIRLLTEGSHVLWIAGYRISEYYKITDDTKTILEVRLDGGTGSG